MRRRRWFFQSGSSRRIKRAVVASGFCASGFLFGVGCGPVLRQSQTFTPQVAKGMVFDDQCQLQNYFDQSPPAYLETSSSLVEGSDPKQGKIGKLTVNLDEKKHIPTFIDLTQRLYKGVPPLDAANAIQATLEFSDKNNLRSIPIGAATEIQSGSLEFSLPYHPCLSAYFFGHTQYAMRKKLIESQIALRLPEDKTSK